MNQKRRPAFSMSGCECDNAHELIDGGELMKEDDCHCWQRWRSSRDITNKEDHS
jgi:hypothetical protein